MNIIANYIRTSFKKNFIVKKNGIFVIFDVLLNYLGLYIFWLGIGNLTNNVFWQKNFLIFIGYGIIAKQVMNFFIGIKWLETFILTGKLDIYLLKPYSTILLICLDHANFLVIILGLIVGNSILLYNIPVYLYFNLLIGLLLTIISTISIELIGVSITLFAFRFGKIQRLKNIVESYKMTINYPTIFFNGIIYKIFTIIIPISYISTIPTLNIFNKLSYMTYIVLILNILIVYILYKILWKRGLEIYDSKN